MRAACDEDRAPEVRPQEGDEGRIGVRGWFVVFQVADRADGAGGCTNAEPAMCILGALRKQQAEPGEQRCPKTAQEEVAGERAVAHAGVDDGDRDAGAVALDQHAGPELGFHENDERGFESAEVWANGEGEIERVVEDPVRAKALAGDTLAGGCCGGHNDTGVGQGQLQRVYQAGRGDGFANRHSVEPDRLNVFGAQQPLWNDAEPVPQTFAIAALPEHAPEPHRAGHNDGEAQQKAVKDHHARRPCGAEMQRPCMRLILASCR